MPIPKPHSNESKQKYINRCVLFLKGEGTPIDQALEISYSTWCNPRNEMTSEPDLTPSEFNKNENLIDGIYAGRWGAAILPNALYANYYSNLMGAVGYGYGLPSDFVFESMQWETAMSFKKNVEFFSGAKTFNQVQELSDYVFNADGFKRKFSEFKAKALEINENYNIKWLKTEQNAAFRISQSAESWQQFEQEKDIFPLLMYQTVKDSRVRPEHAQWDGIIRPVNDPFWNDRMPPNDFGCRCIVIQLREGKVSDLRGVPKNESKVFSNNSGKTGVIFPKTGIPYKIPNEYKKAASENFGLVTPSDKEVRDIMNKIK